MLFSIIVPMYNSEKSIRNCIDSILSQTFSDFEIIIINDGSTDESLYLIEKYAQTDPRIKIYSFSNSGVSISRQRGVTLSSGEYILFVDSDDTINPELLEKLYFNICQLNSPDIIRYQCKLINDVPYKDHQRYNFNDSLYIVSSGIQTLKMWSLFGKKYAVYWLFAFRRSVFSNILYFPNLKCYEDIALIPILIAKSRKVVGIGYIGYNYTYNNSTSITNTSNELAEKSRAIDFVKAYNYAIKNIQNIDNLSISDFAFFIEDYNRRLRDKFNSLSPMLKEELYEMYNI